MATNCLIKALLLGTAAVALGTANASSSLAESALSSASSIWTASDTGSQASFSSDADTLLAVGPAVFSNDLTQSWLSVFSTNFNLDDSTIFPRGAIAAGDYIAVIGSFDQKGNASASSIINLGGTYIAGVSPVYLRGPVTSIDSTGHGQLQGTYVDLTQSYTDPDILHLRAGMIVEVMGVESISPNGVAQIHASQASILTGITGSGARGLTGSGARGITGSGARGITGSGARGITGSGARGITGSGARGLFTAEAG